jgi:microcystin-dependent protein
LIEAETVNVSNATITNGFVGFLDVSNAIVDILDVSAASINSLDASNASITNGSITNLDVSNAVITYLDVSAASAHSLDVSAATISSLNVSSANINSLDVSAGVITSHGIPITVPTGCITMYGGTDDFIPVGWIICDGRAILRNDYPALFNTIGTIYGSGNGSTTFNIPNMIMKFPAGAGSSYTLGSTGGASTKTLGVTEIPAHTHDVASSTTGAGGLHNHTVSGSTDSSGNHAHVFELLIPNTSNSNGDTTNPKWGSGNNNNNTDNDGFLTNNTEDAGSHSHTVSGTTATVNDHTHTIPASTTTSVGGGSAFSIIPPYLSLNYIIKY